GPSRGGGPGGGGGDSARAQYASSSRKEQAKSVDYSPSSPQLQASSRSKSSDNVFEEASGQGDLAALSLDSNTLKRMLDPLPPSSSSSPDQQPPAATLPSAHRRSLASALTASRDRQHRSESGRRRSLERSVGLDLADGSPPSDHFLYDNLCYATTPPSSSNESSSDEGGHGVASSADQRGRQPHEESPTSKLLMEYETHLRNALARGLDAESYSLHTFEALLTQSMENVVALMREVHVELEAIRKEEHALKTQPSLHGFRGLLEQRLAQSGKAGGLAAMAAAASSSSLSRRSTLLSQAASSLSVESNHALFAQASVESTDSRIYLTSSELSGRCRDVELCHADNDVDDLTPSVFMTSH
ncbi:hypothetical protein HPB47_023331, partial [Ixodes persulcatus]